AGIIKDKGEYTANNIAVALQDFLICLEMLPFALGYLYAFPWDPYQHPHLGSRLPLSFALSDAFGLKDVWIDMYHTFKGTTYKYTRISQTGFLEQQQEDGVTDFVLGDERHHYSQRMCYGSTGESSAAQLSHTMLDFDIEDGFGDGFETPLLFEGPEEDPELEEAFKKAKELLFGDYNYPVINDLRIYQNPPVSFKLNIFF
ncbi:hypothetical protein HK096_007923, partial [Nowakowskiella sp. JEL0078]